MQIPIEDLQAVPPVEVVTGPKHDEAESRPDEPDKVDLLSGVEDDE